MTDLPMFRRLGDHLQFTFNGRLREGTVSSVDRDGVLVTSGREYFLETDSGFVPLDASTLRQTNQTKPDTNTMPHHELKTVQDILNIKPGDRENPSWVNDTFIAKVTHPEFKKSEKGPCTAKLEDPHDSKVFIRGNFWSTNPKGLDGKLVKFSGGGMSRTKYNWTYEGKTGTRQEVNLGEKTVIDEIQSDEAPRSAPAKSAPAQQSGSQPDFSNFNTPHGATVGMAMKLAGDLFVAKLAEPNPGIDIIENLQDVAWRLIVASHELERRQLPKVAALVPVEAQSEEDDIPFDEPKPEAKDSLGWDEPPADGWKEFVWPKTGVTLGKTEQATLKKRLAWAVGKHDDENPEVKRCVHALLAMGTSTGWLDLMLDDAIIQHGINPDAFDAFTKGKFKSVKLSQANTVWCINHIAEIKTELDAASVETELPA